MRDISKTFQRFADVEAKNRSPLYAAWSVYIANDAALYPILSQLPLQQPMPNLFFASVQAMCRQFHFPLQAIFDQPPTNNFEQSYQLLVQTCQRHEALLIPFFARRVQTNEIQRASYLYPIFSRIAERSNKPLTLIEIGTSAGLLLNVDALSIQVAQAQPITLGPPSPVTLCIRNDGDSIPLMPPFEVHARFGIDLHCIDLQDDAQFEWLYCLIWPEQQHRRNLLTSIRTFHASIEKTCVSGDFLTLIPPLLQQVQTAHTQVVLFHTHVANQFPAKLKQTFVEELKQWSHECPIYHVFNNLYTSHIEDAITIEYVYQGHVQTIQQLAPVDAHGHSLHWHNNW